MVYSAELNGKYNSMSYNIEGILAVSHGKGYISMFDFRAPEPVIPLQITNTPVRDLKFSPILSKILATCYSDRIALFDIRNLEKKVSAAAHSVG